MMPNGPIWLQYQVRSWSLTTVPTQELVSTPPGVVCPVHKRKFLPKLSNQFSLTMETVIQVSTRLISPHRHPVLVVTT